MAAIADFATDQLGTTATPEVQRTAARMAQDAFASIFRLTLSDDITQLTNALTKAETHCFNWSLADTTEQGRALRLALLANGIDQWGLAYSQTFDLKAIPAISALLGNLRARLSPQTDAQFQIYFSQINEIETDAIDFKVEVRRSIHLALWHAMIACETQEESQPILGSLCSTLLSLDKKMPQLGWRLVADSLASIQINLLSDSLSASTLAQSTTQQLFESLRQSLTKDRFQAILAHSGQAVLSWQQSRRPKN